MGLIVIGVNLIGRTDGRERVFYLDPFDSRLALRTFDFHGHLETFSPNLAPGVVRAVR